MNLFFMSRILTNIAGLQSFFTFQILRIYHILRYFKISFFRQYSTHMEQFLYPEMKTPHRGVQGHTGASFIVDRSAHIFSLPIIRKSGKHPPTLDIPLHKSLYTTSGSADFKKRRLCYGHTAIFSFTF